LLPTPRAGDIVVIDTLGSHKGKAVNAAIVAPIEQIFAKLKTALRKRQARTIDAVVQDITRTLPSFTQDMLQSEIITLYARGTARCRRSRSSSALVSVIGGEHWGPRQA
jgi:hypothetical protein